MPVFNAGIGQWEGEGNNVNGGRNAGGCQGPCSIHLNLETRFQLGIQIVIKMEHKICNMKDVEYLKRCES